MNPDLLRQRLTLRYDCGWDCLNHNINRGYFILKLEMS